MEFIVKPAQEFGFVPFTSEFTDKITYCKYYSHFIWWIADTKGSIALNASKEGEAKLLETFESFKTSITAVYEPL
jgi:hypothetical protein